MEHHSLDIHDNPHAAAPVQLTSRSLIGRASFRSSMHATLRKIQIDAQPLI
jgi:hypothetical protein